MSVQFGRWNFEGQAPAPDYIEKVSTTLAPYGPDSNESYSKGGVRILYRAFHTTKESRREKQPHICPSGAVITWDGRLDNRGEIIRELRDALTVNSTDVAIVATAYEKWGANCLGKLIGDWALSIWNPGERSVLLAKDPIGTKHLYYSFDDNRLAWSTILDPLILFAGKTFEISEEYVAGWFAIRFPAAHLTPYVDVHAVPPSSYVHLGRLNDNVKRTVTKYWDFDPSKRIRYRTDAEYEEHFRSALATAVKRRLRTDRPVLAELSGGMDSSAIVCLADSVIACGDAECPRLDTISWFDSSNSNWDDPVYFAKVEEKRGCIGCHIDLCALDKDAGSQKSLASEFDNNRFAATAVPRTLSEHFKRYAAYMRSRGHRVTLSGIGGEQPTGGCTPTPMPELQNLLSRARFFKLVRQLRAWAAKMGKPKLPLFGEAVLGFLPLAVVGPPKNMRPAAPWLHPGFVRRNRAALSGYSSGLKLFGPLPSFQDHLHMLDCERRVMGSFLLYPELLREARYPYHDRDFREFAYAIPYEQVVRVGQRRSLMRRALVGIVPDELLNRKQKSFFPEPMKKTSWECPSFVDVFEQLVCTSLGIIDPNRFSEALRRAQRNEEVHLEELRRTLTLESWLRHLATFGVLQSPPKIQRDKSNCSLLRLRNSNRPLDRTL